MQTDRTQSAAQAESASAERAAASRLGRRFGDGDEEAGNNAGWDDSLTSVSSPSAAMRVGGQLQDASDDADGSSKSSSSAHEEGDSVDVLLARNAARLRALEQLS